LVGHLDVQILVENQQRLSHRLHDGFCEGLDLLKDRIATFAIGDCAGGSEH
jgi:hypothetical protein